MWISQKEPAERGLNGELSPGEGVEDEVSRDVEGI